MHVSHVLHQLARMFVTCMALMFGTADAADVVVKVLDRNGKPLSDAVVLLESAIQGVRPAPQLDAVVRQEKLRFAPYVTVVGVGAKVAFTNQDPWDHHVIIGLMGAGGMYLDPAQNTQFRLSGRAGDVVARESRTLSKAGAYLLGCHLHSSMRGHIYVADTPWARLTDSEGHATLTGVPDGPVQIRIWHPDQVVDGPAVAATAGASGGELAIGTQIVALKRR